MGLAKTGIHESAKIVNELRQRDRSLDRFLPKLQFCVDTSKSPEYVYQMIKSYRMEDVIEALAPKIYDYVKAHMPKKAQPKAEPEPVKEEAPADKE